LDSSIHPRIHQGAKQESAIFSVEWRSRWTGTGDKINLPTEINRRHPERDEFRTPKMSQKKVKAVFCAAVWL